MLPDLKKVRPTTCSNLEIECFSSGTQDREVFIELEPSP